jgi:glycine dehydrogenase subunit 1
VYLSMLGRNGLRALADANYRRAHTVAARLESAGAPLLVRSPFFNEFVVRAPDVVRGWDTIAEREGLVPGFPIGRWLPEYADGLLVCVTEVASDAAIDRLVEVVAGTTGRVRASGGR